MLIPNLKPVILGLLCVEICYNVASAWDLPMHGSLYGWMYRVSSSTTQRVISFSVDSGSFAVYVCYFKLPEIGEQICD